MRVEWSPEAIATASRFMDDTAGLTAVLDATEALAAEPQPPEAFRWGEVSRLRVGRYRVFYTVAGDAVTIDRVDRVAR